MKHNYFDSFIDEYAEEQEKIQPEFYKNAAVYINRIIEQSPSDCRVLDIGNGGVINYNSDVIGELICADLSVSNKAVKKYELKKNIKFVVGDMLNLTQWKDNIFDIVIVQTVIHHLADRRLNQTEKNVSRGIEECVRVLKPGGRLLIIESTVTKWFEKCERIFYPVMQWCFRILNFDTVYQYSHYSLVRKIKMMGFLIEETDEVQLDKYVWIMRKKVPTCLTPCKACWICVKKSKK